MRAGAEEPLRPQGLERGSDALAAGLRKTRDALRLREDARQRRKVEVAGEPRAHRRAERVGPARLGRGETVGPQDLAEPMRERVDLGPRRPEPRAFDLLPRVEEDLLRRVAVAVDEVAVGAERGPHRCRLARHRLADAGVALLDHPGGRPVPLREEPLALASEDGRAHDLLAAQGRAAGPIARGAAGDRAPERLVHEAHEAPRDGPGLPGDEHRGEVVAEGRAIPVAGEQGRSPGPPRAIGTRGSLRFGPGRSAMRLHVVRGRRRHVDVLQCRERE